MMMRRGMIKFTKNKKINKNLLKPTDELSFNHEFATGQEDRNCDLSSMSLVEAPSRSASVFLLVKLLI